MLSEDDLDLRDLSSEELDLAWDLWFDIAQTTNEEDPPYSHGVFQFVQFSAHLPAGPDLEPRHLDAGRWSHPGFR